MVAIVTGMVVGVPGWMSRFGATEGTAMAAAVNCPSPTVSNSPCIKYGFKDGPVIIPETLTTMAVLPLPKGKYVISAKLYVQNASDYYVNAPETVECQLVAGPNFDWAKQSLPPTYDGQFQYTLDGTMSLIVANTFTSAGSAELKCLGRVQVSTDTPHLRAYFMKITAERVGTLVRVSM